MLKTPYWSSSFRIILSLDIAISFTWALASERVTLLRSFFCLLPCLSENKNKNPNSVAMSDTISSTQFSRDNAKQFFKQKHVYYAIWDKVQSEGAWLDFKRKCTQEWVWNQKQLWYLLDCDPQPLLPKHTEWMGLVPCVLGCRPNFLTQGRWTGPTTPVLSGQSWVALLSSWG